MDDRQFVPDEWLPQLRRLYVFGDPYQLTSEFAGCTNVKLAFADLAGDEVGQTTGNTITLDTNAAGHNWFIDSTPWGNSEFVATLGSSLLFGFTRQRRPKGEGQGMVLPPLKCGNSNGTDTFVVTPTPTCSLSSTNGRCIRTSNNGDFSTLDPSLAQYGWDTRGSTSGWPHGLAAYPSRAPTSWVCGSRHPALTRPGPKAKFLFFFQCFRLEYAAFTPAS